MYSNRFLICFICFSLPVVWILDQHEGSVRHRRLHALPPDMSVPRPSLMRSLSFHLIIHIADLQDSLTVDFGRRPGVAFTYKMMQCVHSSDNNNVNVNAGC